MKLLSSCDFLGGPLGPLLFFLSANIALELVENLGLYLPLSARYKWLFKVGHIEGRLFCYLCLKAVFVGK